MRSNNTNRKLRDVAEEVALTGQLSQPPTHDAPNPPQGRFVRTAGTWADPAHRSAASTGGP